MSTASRATKNQHQDSVRETIRNGAVLSNAYLLMNVLAAAIATYGLFGNSPAVVISAMIVAVLLGPIVGVSLALVDIDMKLLVKSLVSLLAGAVGVMITAFLIGTSYASGGNPGFVGSHLVEVRFDQKVPGTTIIRAVMRGPQPPSAAQVAALEAQ
jgi:hypothetical protein